MFFLAYCLEINAQQFSLDRSRRSRACVLGVRVLSLRGASQERSSLDGCRRPQDFALKSAGGSFLRAVASRLGSPIRSAIYFYGSLLDNNGQPNAHS